MMALLYAGSGVVYTFAALWAVPLLWEIDGVWAFITGMAFLRATLTAFGMAFDEVVS